MKTWKMTLLILVFAIELLGLQTLRASHFMTAEPSRKISSQSGSEGAADSADTASDPKSPDPKPEAVAKEAVTTSKWNLATRTLGGKQFWTDELIEGGWRIQRNVLSGHCRLLDPKNTRHAWGAWENCLSTWHELREQQELTPYKKRVVILLHGLGRTRGAMAGMAEYLTEHGDFSAVNVSYASTRDTIDEHAKALARIIEHLDGVEEIYFVAHSMGNLVIRHYLGDQMAQQHGNVDSRFRRFVMLAPPNNGTHLAERFKSNSVFRWVFGKSGEQMGAQWDSLQQRLATPPFPFGIVAGGAEGGDGRNPLLSGDDDMVVTVQETRLVGAADFMVVPVLHTTIMDHPDVRQYVLRFLEDGYFLSEEQRQPIRAVPADHGEQP